MNLTGHFVRTTLIVFLFNIITVSVNAMETYFATVLDKGYTIETSRVSYYVHLDINGQSVKIAITEPFFRNVKVQDVFVLPKDVPISNLADYLKHNEIEIQRPLGLN